MSRTNKPNTASTVKQSTNSSEFSKPVPTQWKDRLNQDDYEELKNNFDVFDDDNSGTIDPIEINKILAELGLDKRKPFILTLINALKEKNKPIKFHEFVDIIASKVGETRTKDGLKRVFALYDNDQSGVVYFYKFKIIAQQIHDSINDDQLLEIMHSSHVNHKTASNEGFSFEQFYNIVSKFAHK